MRAARRALPLALGLALALFAAVRCGSDKKHKDDDGAGDKPPVDTPVPVPSGWDGTTDWTGSAWEAIDE